MTPDRYARQEEEEDTYPSILVCCLRLAACTCGVQAVANAAYWTQWLSKLWTHTSTHGSKVFVIEHRMNQSAEGALEDGARTVFVIRLSLVDGVSKVPHD